MHLCKESWFQMDIYHDCICFLPSLEDSHTCNGWACCCTLLRWGRGRLNTHQNLQNKTHVDPKYKNLFGSYTSCCSCCEYFYGALRCFSYHYITYLFVHIINFTILLQSEYRDISHSNHHSTTVWIFVVYHGHGQIFDLSQWDGLFCVMCKTTTTCQPRPANHDMCFLGF